MTNTERIQANNADLRECIEITNTLPDAETAVEVVLQSKIVTPNETAQEVTADADYTALEKVTVEPIPSEYIVPSGTIEITENGTHDVMAYSAVAVNVASAGGNVKIATGTFTATATSGTAPMITHNLGTKKIIALVWIPSDTVVTPTAGYQVFSASYVNAPAFFGDSIQVDCTGYNSGKFSEVSTVKYSTLSLGAVGRSPWTSQANFTAPNVSSGASGNSKLTDDTFTFVCSSSFIKGYTYNYLIIGICD